MATQAHVTIYHNPRCTKSRQTLQLLRRRGIEPAVVEYLNEAPDEQQLRSLLKKLRMRPMDLIRRKEKQFTDLGLEKKQNDDTALIRAMAKNPILIERPIVIKGTKAALGRPPENVLEIL